MSTDAEKSALCLSCLRCCKSVSFFTQHTEDMGEQYWADAVYFYKARGFKVSFHDVVIDGNQKRVLAIEIPDFPCPHLTPNGCNFYDTRPNACRRYDGYAELKEECAWRTLPEYQKEV